MSNEKEQWNFFELLRDADLYIKGKDIYKEHIEETPLVNELPSWIAEFTLEQIWVQNKKRKWPHLVRGIRVDGETVVITVKGGNDAARLLCHELLKEKEK